MKWIYDEALAQEHLQDDQKKVQDLNAWVKKENIRVTLLFVLWLIVTAVAVGLVKWLLPADYWMIGFLAIPCGILSAIYACAWLWSERVNPSDENPRNRWEELPNDVKYLLASEGKTILSREACPHENCGGMMMNIFLVLEDDEHLVSRSFICSLERKVSTAVTEEVVDIAKGVFLVPYTGAESASAVIKNYSERQ